MKKFNLFIDTSNNFLVFLFFWKKKVINFFQKKNTRKNHQLFYFFLKKELKKVDLELKNIRKLYLIFGPGSFTGIKVSITFAITLFTLKKKLKEKFNLYVYDSLSFQICKEEKIINYINAFFDKYYILYLPEKNNFSKNIEKIRLINKKELNLILKKNLNLKIKKNYKNIDFQKHFFLLKKHFIEIKKAYNLKPLYMKNYDEWRRNN